ncbi:MAG: 6-phosphogluconolactonase [Opitutaceae bacterium]|nr:6-phosphogluconolactonase [Verrucomicrobiales bacterium]
MSSHPIELLRFANAAALADAAAKAWIRAVTESGREKKPHFVALSGGRIVRDFYQNAVKAARAQHTSFGHVHFFWGDERCVHPDDPESNFGLAQALLFEPLAINDSRIHRIHGELPAAEAASKMNTEVFGLLPQNASGRPIFDLIFLGLGEDAHVASLFPGAPAEVIAADGPFLPVTGPKPPPQRITVSYRTISEATEVWVLASGTGKEKALSDSLKANSTTPLGRVLAGRASTQIFTDIRDAT